jgi:hypothetical protein
MPKKIGTLTLYSVDDLHEKLGISKLTLRNYFKEGKLKGRKLGVSWYITEEALKEYFEGSIAGANASPGSSLSATPSAKDDQASTPAEFYQEQVRVYRSPSSREKKAGREKRDPRKARALRYVIQGLNDLVSESEECNSIEEAIDCIKAQAIISLFEVVVIEPESGVELEKIRARDFLRKYDT